MLTAKLVVALLFVVPAVLLGAAVKAVPGGGFQGAVSYSSEPYPISVALGDFNGDGKVDLAVANANQYGADVGNVSILLGNGDGTFQAAVKQFAGAYPYSVAVGDFNGDGKADLAVANRSSGPNDGNVSVLLGNGDGTFQAAVNQMIPGADPVAVAVGDFNRDGKADLAVANDGVGGGVSVLLGNGDGTLQAAVPYVTGSSGSLAVAVSDFNGDGRTDLVVSNPFDPYVSVLLGNGDGTFQAAANQMIPGGYHPFAVAVGDFNADGKPDLAITNNGTNITDNGFVSVLLGNSNGTFQTGVNLTAGAHPIAVAVGDFNGDGKDDLAVANYGTNDGTGYGNASVAYQQWRRDLPATTKLRN